MHHGKVLDISSVFRIKNVQDASGNILFWINPARKMYAVVRKSDVMTSFGHSTRSVV
jgi:hypothetical protein